MNQSKKCNTCELSKLITEFPVDRNYCKDCKSAKDIKRRKQSNHDGEIKILIEKFASLSKFPDTWTKDEIILSMISISDEIQNILKHTIETMTHLSFVLSITPTTQKYLMKIYKNNGDFRKAKHYLNDPDIAAFEEYFGISKQDVNLEEIINLEKATNFVRIIYNALVTDKMTSECSKFSNEDPHIEVPIISYSPAISSIVLSRNTLSINYDKFMSALKKLKNNKDPILNMCIEHGMYDCFMNLIHRC